MKRDYSVYSENEIAVVLIHPAMDYRGLFHLKEEEREERGVLPAVLSSYDLMLEEPLLDALNNMFCSIKYSALYARNDFCVLPYESSVHAYLSEKGIPFTYLYPDFSLIAENTFYVWKYMWSLSFFKETPQCRKIKLDTFDIASLGREGFSKLVTFDKRKLKDIKGEKGIKIWKSGECLLIK